MTFQLAWRNIWRNPRRTGVILTAVVVGVCSMVVLGALMEGVSRQMLHNAISTLTGSLQIHRQGYRVDPVVENSIENPEAVRETLDRELPPGAKWTERVRVNAVVNNARNSGGVTLVGMAPDREAAVSFIGDAVSAGEYLAPDDDLGILVGAALAEDFDTEVGKRLVVMSQDRTGEIASRAFVIRGIYRAELESTEKRYAFVSISAAQEMLRMDGAVSEFAALLPETEPAEPVAGRLRTALPDQFSVHSWRELLPLIEVQLQMTERFRGIWYLVVFIAMGFGIVNTLLMAVFERMREFGLLKALGMKNGRILREVLAESLILLVLGVAAGNLLALSIVAWLAHAGIDLTAFAAGTEFAGISRVIYPSLQAGEILKANAVVLVLGLVVSVYPALKAARFTPVEAMARQ
jgi:ABC-type lipoprotein release transport system permease subunit